MLAISTLLGCNTFAPCLAISNISSYEIEFNFTASLQIRGSVVYIPSTSVYISHNFALRDAERATAVVSDPPRPKVVIS